MFAILSLPPPPLHPMCLLSKLAKTHFVCQSRPKLSLSVFPIKEVFLLKEILIDPTHPLVVSERLLSIQQKARPF